MIPEIHFYPHGSMEIQVVNAFLKNGILNENVQSEKHFPKGINLSGIAFQTINFLSIETLLNKNLPLL